MSFGVIDTNNKNLTFLCTGVVHVCKPRKVNVMSFAQRNANGSEQVRICGE